MFNQMMALPLLQGASHEQLETIIEKVPFHFLKLSDGEKFIATGDECTHLRFIVSGSVRIVTASVAARLTLSQFLDAPDVIGPEFLFGRRTVYPYDVFASGSCGILQILKSDYIDILQSNPIFILNILNYLSLNSQKRAFSILAQSKGHIAERLAKFIITLTTAKSYGTKLSFRQKDLCLALGARRASLLNALSELREKGIIDYSLSEIQVLNRKALAALVDSSN